MYFPCMIPGKHLTPTRPLGDKLHNKPPAPTALRILPAQGHTRNSLLQASSDCAALCRNAPARLSQRKSPVTFRHSSHGSHHNHSCSAPAPHPPWAAQRGSAITGLSAAPHTYRTPPGSPVLQACCSFSPPVGSPNIQTPQNGGEGVTPSLSPLLGAVSGQHAEHKDTMFIWRCVCWTSSSGWGEGG